MAWTTPLTAVANVALTAAQWNASVRDNLLETAPAKVTTSGQILTSTAANTVAARTPVVASISAAETTTLTSYGDLTAGTQGPAITATTGAKAQVSIHARCVNSVSGNLSQAGWHVTGATTLAASDDFCIGGKAGIVSQDMWVGGTWLFTGLAGGANTFEMHYKVNGGTGTFGNRRISIVPFS